MAELTDFGFSRHPFALVPSSGVTNWAGRDNERRLLRDIVESVLTTDTGLSEFVLLHGSYGAGKSHALKYLTTLITATEAAHFNARAIYLPKVRVDQRVDFVRIYKEIIAELGNDFFRRLARTTAQRVDSAADALGREMHRDKEKELIRKNPHYFREQVLEMLDEDIRPIVQMLQMLDAGNENVLKYLSGGKHTIGEAGFEQPIDSDYAATRMLAGIFRVMTLEIGEEDPAFRAVYLFADEVEDMLDLKLPEQLAIWNGFRELLNSLPQNFCLLLSFAADGALLEATVPQALSERTSRQNIELQSLEVAEAKEFIADHLEDFRRADFEATQPYYPFTEEAIDYVLETIVVMVPRKMFRSLRTVLERAVRREGLQPGEEISAQMAEEILVSMGM